MFGSERDLKMHVQNFEGLSQNVGRENSIFAWFWNNIQNKRKYRDKSGVKKYILAYNTNTKY